MGRYRAPNGTYPMSIYNCPCKKHARNVGYHTIGILGGTKYHHWDCDCECEYDYNLEKLQRSVCPFIEGQPKCMLDKCAAFDDYRKECKKMAQNHL